LVLNKASIPPPPLLDIGVDEEEEGGEDIMNVIFGSKLFKAGP